MEGLPLRGEDLAIGVLPHSGLHYDLGTSAQRGTSDCINNIAGGS